MPELTATQIAAGAKNVRPLTPTPATRGRWRCCVCRRQRWRKGTLQDALDHYQAIHMKEETR